MAVVDSAIAAVTDTASTSGGVLWQSVMSGGWWNGDISFMLWLALAAVVLIPMSGVGWVTGLPERKRGHRPDRKIPSSTRMLFSLVLFGAMAFILNHGGIPLWDMVKGHILPVSLGLIPFLGIGYAWARLQYGNFAEDNKDEVRSIGDAYCKDVGLDPATVMKDVGKSVEFTFPDESHQRKWPSYFNNAASACLVLAGVTADSPKTLFLKNKEQITMWILFWPTSLLFRFWSDIVGRGFDKLLMASRGFFEKASAKHDIKVSYATTPPTTPDAMAEGSETVVPLGGRRAPREGNQG